VDNGGTNEGPPNRPGVLIVEDEWLIATDLAEAVRTLGYEVVGPVYSVSAALDLLDTAQVDGALLDVNLRGETSYPVAEALAARGIPFAFLSGYASSQLRTDFEDCPLLSKPVGLGDLRSRLDQMLQPS
jgi:CheY-like chemotaxis protein